MNLRQQDMPAEDLSDLAGPGSRGAGLAGLVGDPAATPTRSDEAPRRTATRAGDLTGAATIAAVPDIHEDAGTARPRPRKPGRPRTRVKPTTAVYVSPGVKKRFEAYRHNRKVTNLQVVLEAISSKHGELAEIIRESTFNTAPVNPLFPADPSAVRYVGGGSVQISFSPTAEQEAVIDQIGADLGIDTRSTWIAPVLNAFLPGRKDSPPTGT